MFFPKSSLRPGVAPREVFGWAAFDFANLGYTTVVLTAVYNAYFVNVVAGNASWATLLWTVIIAVSSAIGMVVMPVIGTLADAHAKKRSGLFIATVVCIAATFGLTLTGEGTIVWAALMIILSNLAFNIGETLNSAFLPEIASDEGVGKVSGWGWSFGYCGGLVTLGLSLLLVTFGPELWGLDFDGSVAGTLWITGIVFAVATVPTFAWLKERAVPKPDAPRAAALFSDSMASLKKTASALPQLKHFGRLTLTGFLNQCGVSVVITLSAVYATAVMGFTLNDSILLVFLVNITAAVGAFVFGYVEDKIGHKKSLMLTLWIWVAMIVVAATSEGVVQFWIAANLAGIAMGSSQSAGRAMVAVLSPAARSAEFYGFWNMALWFANIVGPLTYGAVTWVSGNNHRLAIAITGLFFLAAIVVLKTLDMEEGRREALAFEKKVRAGAGETGPTPIKRKTLGGRSSRVWCFRRERTSADGLFTALVDVDETLRVLGEVVHLELFVAGADQLKRVVAHRGVLEFANDALCTLDRGDISVALVVILRGPQFVLSLRENQTVHAATGVRCETALREAKNEFLVDVEGFSRGVGVAFRHVFRKEPGDEAVVFVHRGERLQIENVVAVGVIRIAAQEAVGGLNGHVRVAVLPVGVDRFDLSLLSILTEGITRLKLLIVLFGLCPVAVVQCGAGFRIQFVGRPVERRVRFQALKPGAGRRGERRDRYGRRTNEKSFHRNFGIHDKHCRERVSRL